MAFSKTPTQDTYDTKRFPLVGMPQQRDGTDTTKDQRFLNCFTEQIKAQITDAKKFYLKKRNGLHKRITQAGVARGCIYEPTTKHLYFVVDSTIYSYDGVTITTVQTGLSVSGNCGFTVHLTTTVSVIVVTGTEGYVINPVANTATKITDADFPTPHLPYPVSIDGYLIVAKANTADIYNSDLDNPLSWTPSNFITAEMYPDNIVAMTKNNNYVIAVGTGSMEFFYDIGNATGSPLQRNDSAVQQMGTDAPDSVVQTEKEVILVGDTGNGGRTVWLIEGFTATEVGTEAVRLSLNDLGENISGVNAYCIRVSGHKLYVLRLPAVNRTWVFDFDSKLWSEWSTYNGSSQVVFSGKFAADSQFGFPYMQGAGGEIYLLDDTTYQDDGQPITTQMTTLKLDFDSMMRKTISKLSIFGDWPLNTTSTVLVEWSDDDYRTWNSNPRTLQLSSEFPWIRNLGRTRRRAFRFTHTDNTPFRIEGIELDINTGIS